MKQLQFTLHTDDYRGDHSADVQIAIAPEKGETLKDMFDRVLVKPTDFVSVRIISEE